MIIKASHRISDIQNLFQSEYPGLKLEFYRSGHDEHHGSRSENQLSADERIADICSDVQEGEIDVSPQRTIAEVENAFENRFGLHVQIFRRSHNLWLQTISTDDWTLEVQNRKGIHSIGVNN